MLTVDPQVRFSAAQRESRSVFPVALRLALYETEMPLNARTLPVCVKPAPPRYALNAGHVTLWLHPIDHAALDVA